MGIKANSLRFAPQSREWARRDLPENMDIVPA